MVLIQQKDRVVVAAPAKTPVEVRDKAESSFSPTDISGLYSLVSGDNGCAQSIQLGNAEPRGGGAFVVTHADIAEEGVPCSGNGSLLIIPRDGDGSAGAVGGVLRTQPLASVGAALVSAGASFLIALDQSPRVCGAAVGVPAFTLTILTRPIQPVSISEAVILHAHVGYMLVYRPDDKNAPCVYVRSALPGNSQPSPKQTPVAVPDAESGDGNTEENDTPNDDAESIEDDDIQPSVTEIPPELGIPSSVPNSSIGTPVASAMPTTLSPAEDDTAGDDDGDDGNSDDNIDGIVQPSEAPSVDADEGPACFPGDTTVRLSDGNHVRMDALKVGDWVLGANGTYVRIFGFSHRDPWAVRQFVRLETARGHTLTATRGHYIWVDDRLVAAGSIRIGDHVLSNGSPDMIVGIRSHLSKGLYNPHTLSGNIVVDGILASTYTTAVAHPVAHALLAPLRAAFRVASYSSGCLYGGVDSLLRFAPRGSLLV